MLPLAFSTLGCPEWPLERIARAAMEYGYSGVEIRGVEEHVDLRASPHFTPSRIPSTRALFADSGLSVCCLGSSASFADPLKRADSMDEARAYVDIAAGIGCPLIRVFGGNYTEGDRVLAVADSLSELAPYAEARNVSILLETHDQFSTGRSVAGVLEQVRHNSVGALWDLHHPFREGELPEMTASMLLPYLRHTHVKDSRDGTYCLLGDGDVPIREMLQLLPEDQALWISLEWEKRWHPEIADPEQVFPQYASKLREYMSI